MRTWRKWVIVTGVALAALLLTWAIGSAAAQGPQVGPLVGGSEPVGSRISYQGVLKEGGSPVTGARDMVFRLYQDSPRSLLRRIDLDGVEVTDGRFSVALDLPTEFLDGRALCLAVEIGGVAMECQELLAAPYALGLRPGALIRGEVAPPSAALNVFENSGGVGIHGQGSEAGVQGQGDTVGVRGVATASGEACGVYGESGHIGVYGKSDLVGVYGAGRYGVHGEAFTTWGRGVVGTASASTGPVYGVYGNASAATGSVYGVYGYVRASGDGQVATGVYGESRSDNGYGVAGFNYFSGVGVGAWSNSGNLIEAYDGAYPDGALRFYVDQSGNVLANGEFYTYVSAQGEDVARAVSAVQSPEAWIEDFGSAALEGGRARVAVEPLYAETVNLEASYHVFLTPLGDCGGLYVAEKTARWFEVRELGGGTSNVAFDYRVVAKRSGYEDVRLEQVALPEAMESERRREDAP
jgi:hypothetical protein